MLTLTRNKGGLRGEHRQTVLEDILVCLQNDLHTCVSMNVGKIRLSF